MSMIYGLVEILSKVTVQYVVPRIRQYLRKLGQERKAEEIRAFLQEIGCCNDHSIRELVETWVRRMGREIDPALGEEIIAVLSSLATRARFLTTEGTPRSSYLRCEHLIEQLISNVEPHFRRGHQVALDQDWRLERFLGMGSFGEVWQALNPHHPISRAYKFFTQEESKEWLRREQQNLFAIKEQLGAHQNIVDFLDVAVNAETPYIVLEYLDGGSLEDWILEDRTQRARLDKNLVLQGIANGLAEAHKNRIYHRDLKPANVLLTTDPNPVAKITDFGLGLVNAGVGTEASMLMTHAAVVGTCMYLPPESQNLALERDPAKDDVFAFGVLWYQLLVERLERPPYDYASLLRLMGIDTHTIRMISRCLAHPHRRFSNAIELADSLREAVPLDWSCGSNFDVQHIMREYLMVRG